MTAEKLAYWFFRLNGCFTFENFIVHPDERGTQRTDVDIVAVRFQHRQELRRTKYPMEDHELFRDQKSYVAAYLVEVKHSECKLNGPWRDPKEGNLQRVLDAMGFVAEGNVEAVAQELYTRYAYTSDLIDVRFVMLGNQKSTQVDWQCVPQLTWDVVLTWIYERFTKYAEQKAHHAQWSGEAQELFRTATKDFANNPKEFVAHWKTRARNKS